VPTYDLHTDRTVHVSRTIMLSELSLLLDQVPSTASTTDYGTAVLGANVLLKRTVSNRQKTFRFLRELYALDPSDPVFSVMRFLWEAEPAAHTRALLALLAAAFSDELLRSTADTILAASPGDRLGKESLSARLGDAYPGRFGEKSLEKIGRNIASSWTQSGHLVGHIDKHRALVEPSTTTTVFATFLGWLQGHRGLLLFTTPWAQLLDANESVLDSHLFAASQRGWVTYKRMNDVVEISFNELFALATWEPRTTADATTAAGRGSR